MDNNIKEYLNLYFPSYKHITLVDTTQHIESKIHHYVSIDSLQQETISELLEKIAYILDTGSILHICNWFANMENGPMLTLTEWKTSLRYMELHHFPVEHWNEKAFIVQKKDDVDTWSDN